MQILSIVWRILDPRPATYCNTFSFGMADRIKSEKIVIGFQEKEEEEENEKLDFCMTKNVP